MAIHEGNTDFNLLVSKTDVKSLLIHWGYSNTTLQKTLQIFRPGDGQMIFTKTYSASVTSGREVVEVPYFGEYRVKISTANGYSWDALKREVHLSSTYSNTYTYTTNDVTSYKQGQLTVIALFSALGLTSRAAIAVTATAVSLLSSVSTVWRHDTNLEAAPAPKAGWKFRTTLEPVSGGVRATYTTLNDLNSPVHSRNTTMYYLKY